MDCSRQCHYISVFILFIQGVFLSSEAKLHEVNAGEEDGLQLLFSPIKKLNYVNNFYLWTRENNREYEKIYPDSVQFSTFKKRKTFIIIHGFLGNGLESWVTTLKDHMLMREDSNVISVDWPAGIPSWLFSYYDAVKRVPYVAEDITYLLKSLIFKRDFTVDLLHLVGHSLGAHVSGFVGKSFHGNISRITGLDPAGLEYHNTDASQRLDKSDAEYVDVMHTNGCTTVWVWTDCYGINQDLGHSDFWPNGGKYQPACSGSSKKHSRKFKGDIGCNHEMAYKYYIESWIYGNENTMYLARPCSTWNDFQSGHCSCAEKAQYMGYNVDSRVEGRFYLSTEKHEPFAHKDANCLPGTNGVAKNFFLWTRETGNDTQHEELNPHNGSSIVISHFKNRNTYIIIHGFLSHGLEEWILSLKNKLLMREDCNVISVDWPAGTSWFQPSYDWIIGLLPKVGQDLSALLRLLWKTAGLPVTDVHVIGHSLGAHIAGLSGKTFGGQVRRITALDPAGPRFRNVSSDMRVDKGDAQFVDVIHTNACPDTSNWTYCLGLNESIGHADYWPNGGEHQEKCLKLHSDNSSGGGIGCDHNMAYVYYMESLEYGEEDTLFLARPCTRWDEYKSGECACSKNAQYMGYNVNSRLKGSFYLNTSESAPYARKDGKCRPGADGVYRHFYLWTRETWRDFQREELKLHDQNTLVSSHFVNRTTYFVIHGFLGNGLEKWIMSLKDKLLMREDCNVISVDWPAGTSLFELSYTYTRKLVPKVGSDVAALIAKLSKVTGLQHSHVHIIGHSLGAHVAGFTGKKLGGEVGRITGLDPAGPGFQNVASDKRLGRGDAQYVDVIHTSACAVDHLSTDCHGLNESIGHSDFWPNGGSHQPVCLNDTAHAESITAGLLGCDHEMAYIYFIESLMYGNDDTLYLARPCTNWEEYQSEKCSCGYKAQYLGYNVNTRSRGTFYLSTATSFPFAVEDKKCPPGADGVYKHFYLWTRETATDGQFEYLVLSKNDSIISSHFKDRKTYMIIHGFSSHGNEKWILEMKDKLLMREDCNVISVDWPAGTSWFPLSYPYAVSKVPKVGKDASALLRLLSDLKGLKLSDIHLIGHSHGAHVAGFTGKELGGQLGRITGLDPAGPEYEDKGSDERLDKGDADFVDVIHTNACPPNLIITDCYGLNQSIGHSDIWPNGGAHQPACSEIDNTSLGFIACDHELAYAYYTESIMYDDVDTLYLARSCSSWEEYNSGRCLCSEKAQYMGYNVNSVLSGNYYLNTSIKFPFAKKDEKCFPGAKETCHNFFLWTRSSKKDDQYERLKPYDEKSISSSHFKGGKTYIIIHGFTGNGMSRPVTKIKDNILQKEGCNVISVDWPAGSTLYLPSYEWTLDLVPKVGNDTVALINVLVKIKKLNLREVHIIGHGLGAHIAGLVGKKLSGTVGHITGLDPAGPAFRNIDPGKRLNEEDAVYVDVIHTNGCSNNLTWSDCLGIDDSIGHSDFWPNGGEFQPHCSHLHNEFEAYAKCNHEIALVYYAESILYGIDNTYFLARFCDSWEDYSEGNCSCSENAQYMGYNVNTRLNGSFFIHTSSVPPFAVQDAACYPGYRGSMNVIIASSVGGSVGVIGFAALGVLIFRRLRRSRESGLQINETLLNYDNEPTEA